MLFLYLLSFPVNMLCLDKRNVTTVHSTNFKKKCSTAIPLYKTETNVDAET